MINTDKCIDCYFDHSGGNFGQDSPGPETVYESLTRAATAALVALLLTCGTAQASAWVQVGTGKDGAKVLVDTSSITVKASVRQAWLKMIFAVHAQQGSGDDASKWVDFSLNHAAFNCSEGTSKSDALENHFEDSTSRKVPAQEISGDSWESVPPNTALDTVMKFVCGWK